jgi:hypothetical protein
MTHPVSRSLSMKVGPQTVGNGIVEDLFLVVQGVPSRSQPSAEAMVSRAEARRHARLWRSAALDRSFWSSLNTAQQSAADPAAAAMNAEESEKDSERRQATVPHVR